MKRFDFYSGQIPTEAEFDGAFAAAELADQNLAVDIGASGIYTGGVVSQHAGTPDLTVDITAPITAIDDAGQRILSPASPSPINLSCAVDSNAASTSVVTIGNEKYIAICARSKRVLSDSRIDDASVSLSFVHDESYELVVVQGVEATVGTAAKASAPAHSLILADVHRIFGQTTFLNADISTTRRDGGIRFSALPNRIVFSGGYESQPGSSSFLGDNTDKVITGVGALSLGALKAGDILQWWWSANDMTADPQNPTTGGNHPRLRFKLAGTSPTVAEVSIAEPGIATHGVETAPNAHPMGASGTYVILTDATYTLQPKFLGQTSTNVYFGSIVAGSQVRLSAMVLRP